MADAHESGCPPHAWCYGPVVVQGDLPVVAAVCRACRAHANLPHRGPCRLGEYRRLTGWVAPEAKAAPEPEEEEDQNLFS